jgi:hypothetical protein
MVAGQLSLTQGTVLSARFTNQQKARSFKNPLLLERKS